MNFINIVRTLQTLLEKEELLFSGHLQRMNSNRFKKNFLNTLENWKVQYMDLWNGKLYWGTSNYTWRHHRGYST